MPEDAAEAGGLKPARSLLLGDGCGSQRLSRARATVGGDDEDGRHAGGRHQRRCGGDDAVHHDNTDFSGRKEDL